MLFATTDRTAINLCLIFFLISPLLENFLLRCEKEWKEVHENALTEEEPTECEETID
jgi:hypothetical protein